MPLTQRESNAILFAARALIGTSYQDLDCSRFVHGAYAAAGLRYEYQATRTFASLAGTVFSDVTSEQRILPADVLMFPGHMGLWDSEGCKVLQELGTPSNECRRFNNDLPFLSSRSGRNLGPEFGMMRWFGELRAVYRWQAGTGQPA